MVGGCKGERSGDELGDGSGAPSLQLVATKSEDATKALQYRGTVHERERELGG